MLKNNFKEYLRELLKIIYSLERIAVFLIDTEMFGWNIALFTFLSLKENLGTLQLRPCEWCKMTILSQKGHHAVRGLCGRPQSWCLLGALGKGPLRFWVLQAPKGGSRMARAWSYRRAVSPGLLLARGGSVQSLPAGLRSRRSAPSYAAW